jgi:Ca-activated chloride channel family protein
MLARVAPELGLCALALLVVAAVLAATFGEGLRHVVFAAPMWLRVAPIPVFALLLRAAVRPRPPTMRFSRARSLGRLSRGFWARLAALPDGLRLAAALLLVVALGRPQSTRGADRLRHEGIDIVIVLDLSESMKSTDMVHSRLRAAQMVIDDFIRRRPWDRIGLVVFGSTASTVAPLTMDHGVLRKMVVQLRLGVIDGSRTAIGAGLGVALNRLGDPPPGREASADGEDEKPEPPKQQQVVVLLTDGVHNADGLDPDTAAETAAAKGVQIYTVLMGSGMMGEDSIDPGRLERIAAITGGYAYTATDQNALRGSFQDLLDKLEKAELEGQQIRPELFMWLLWPALGLLVLDVGLRTTRLRRFP